MCLRPREERKRQGREKKAALITEQRLKQLLYKQSHKITQLDLNIGKRKLFIPCIFFLFIYSHLRTPRYRTNQYLVDSVLNGGWQTLSSALRMWSQLCGVERCSKWWRALIKQAHSCWNVGRDLKEWIRQVGSIDYSMRNWRVLMIQPQHSLCGNDWKTPTGCKFCQLTTFTLNATLSCWRKRNLVV